MLHPRCVTNCPPPPPCNCASTQSCFLINRDCNTCSTFTCVDNPGTSSGTQGKGGVSKGALAGAIIGSLIFLALAISSYLWYRRHSRARKESPVRQEIKNDIPAPAETVLNRPNPTEKSSPPPTELNTVRVYSVSSNTTIDLDPESQNSSAHAQYSPSRGSTHNNPFDDNNSIQTAGTEGTNVIPIALVSPDSHRTLSPRSGTETLPSTTSSPMRPARSPDLNLNLDHVNVSHDSLRATAPYAPSQRSGVSGVSSRNSYMSSASYSSDFLHEAPMIITPTKGAVRQVLGVVKAEVINASRSHPTSPNPEGLKPSTIASRPAVGSPLAATSFGPSDVVKESDEGSDISVHGDPFGDEHSTLAVSASASITTFGQASPRLHDSGGSQWIPDGPNLPWSRPDDSSRPSSMSTQAGSIADIGSATRVNVGLNGLKGEFVTASSPLSAGSLPRSPYRTTMGRLVTPPTNNLGSLEEQQQRALAHAQARAQAQGLDISRRVSGSSVMSAASTRADSILESFPFVPPSPISDRPIRSPPCSPLAQQSFNSSPSSPLSQQSFRSKPSSKETPEVVQELESELPAPPNRRTLGLSTASQLSTASTGLGSFPFQIDSGNNSEGNNPPPSAFNGRQRASLDTLALTSDLSSYPLGFDRDSSSTFKKS